ncbi:MAG: TetR/AcrR family transcriptional regulator [Pseudomonadota bacterium]
MSEQDSTRTKILEAARDRFMHYGYSKTTMSEVARDCEMSAGNIYRFFSSKLDIAEAMAEKFNDEQDIDYRRIAFQSKPAIERLFEFFFFSLEKTYTAIEEEAKILEIAEILRLERPEYFNKHLAQERVFLVKILEDGIAERLFRPLENSNTTAEMIQAALMKFRFPQAYSQLKLDQLRYELEGVLRLLTAGLSVGANEPVLEPAG